MRWARSGEDGHGKRREEGEGPRVRAFPIDDAYPRQAAILERCRLVISSFQSDETPHVAKANTNSVSNGLQNTETDLTHISESLICK